MSCKHCGLDCRLRWRTFGNATRHIEATCTACGRFNGWVPQTPDNVAEADANEAAALPGAGLFDGCDPDA